jgi:hypothetical protein
VSVKMVVTFCVVMHVPYLARDYPALTMPEAL